MDPKVLNIGDTVAHSSVGPGAITGFQGNYPMVNGKAVGNLTRTDGRKFGGMASELTLANAAPPNPVSPVGVHNAPGLSTPGTPTPAPPPPAPPVAPPVAPTPATVPPLGLTVEAATPDDVAKAQQYTGDKAAAVTRAAEAAEAAKKAKADRVARETEEKELRERNAKATLEKMAKSRAASLAAKADEAAKEADKTGAVSPGLGGSVEAPHVVAQPAPQAPPVQHEPGAMPETTPESPSQAVEGQPLHHISPPAGQNVKE